MVKGQLLYTVKVLAVAEDTKARVTVARRPFICSIAEVGEWTMRRRETTVVVRCVCLVDCSAYLYL